MANLRPPPGGNKPSRPNDYEVGRAIRAAALTPSAKLMLWAIYDHAGPNGTGKCWTSSENLANEIGIGGKAENRDRQARKIIDGLAKWGWIVVVPRGESKHARVRDILIGPRLWESVLGLWSPSEPTSHPDSGVLELGHESPATRTPESYSLGHGSPTNVSMNGSRNGSRNGTRTPPPPQRPQTDHQRKMAKLAAIAYGEGDDGVRDEFVSLCVERFGEARREQAAKAAAEHTVDDLAQTAATIRQCGLKGWEDVQAILDDPVPY